MDQTAAAPNGERMSTSSLVLRGESSPRERLVAPSSREDVGTYRGSLEVACTGLWRSLATYEPGEGPGAASMTGDPVLVIVCSTTKTYFQTDNLPTDPSDPLLTTKCHCVNVWEECVCCSWAHTN